jgi:hypothetical protein
MALESDRGSRRRGMITTRRGARRMVTQFSRFSIQLWQAYGKHITLAPCCSHRTTENPGGRDGLVFRNPGPAVVSTEDQLGGARYLPLTGYA